MNPQTIVSLVSLISFSTIAVASTKEISIVPTYWAKPLAGNETGEAFSSETRVGRTLTALYNGIEVSLQGDSKALSAVRSSTFSATLTPKGGEKVTQCRVTVRGFADTSSGGESASRDHKWRGHETRPPFKIQGR